jgi:hypothetical protein
VPFPVAHSGQFVIAAVLTKLTPFFGSQGTIPSEIGQLEQLKILQVEDNYLVRNKKAINEWSEAVIDCCVFFAVLLFHENKNDSHHNVFRSNVSLLWIIFCATPQTGTMPSGICDLKEEDNGILALSADCDDAAWVNCTCCTCCVAPCPVVNIPLTRRVLQEEEEGIPMGKMDRLARKLFSFDDLILS